MTDPPHYLGLRPPIDSGTIKLFVTDRGSPMVAHPALLLQAKVFNEGTRWFCAVLGLFGVCDKSKEGFRGEG